MTTASNDEYIFLYSLRGAEEARTIDYWKRSLHSYALENQRLTFSIEEIHEAFTRNGVIPAYFDKSLAVLVKQKAVVDANDLKQDADVTLLTTLMSTLWTSVFPTAETQKRFISSSVLEDIERSVRSAAAMKQGIELIFSHSEPAHSPLNFSQFCASVASSISKPALVPSLQLLSNLSTDDLELVLRFLSTKRVLLFDSEVIQLLPPSSSSSSSSSSTTSAPSSVASYAHSLLTIRRTALDIDRRMQRLQSQSSQYTERAVRAKQQGDMTTALTFLKLRKNVGATLQKLAQAQYQLEESLQTIEGAETNALIIRAYSSATAALKTVREESGVTIEDVETAVERFQEELAEVQEIGEALHSTSALSDEETDALQSELDALLALDETAVTPSVALPSVPTQPVVPIPTTQSPAATTEEQRNVAATPVAM